MLVLPSNRSKAWLYYAAWSELLLGLLMSAAAFHYVSQQDANEAKGRFEEYCTEIHRIITVRLTGYSDLLYGLRGFMRHAPRVTRAEFRNYVAELDLVNKRLGVTSVNYAQSVRNDAKAAFVKSVLQDNRVDIGDLPEFSISPPGERANYHVITYVEPLDANAALLGLDLAAYRVGTAELLEALGDSGDLSSGPGVIPGTGDYQWGLRLASYRIGMPIDTREQRHLALAGSVGLRFSLAQLMQSARSTPNKPRIRIRLHSFAFPTGPNIAFTPTAQNMLIDSAAPPQTQFENPKWLPGGEEPLSWSTAMPFGGRVLGIYFDGMVRDFSTDYDRLVPYLILVLGVMSTLLLFALIHALLRSREDLESAVVERTRELTSATNQMRDERDQRIRLERAMLSVAEEERARLGRELHDDLGQTLTATAYMAQSLSEDLESRWPAGAARASKLEGHLSNAVEKARLLAQGLMPLASQVGSISVALENLAQHICDSYHIDCRVICDPTQILEDRVAAQQLYRIAQEAVLNAVKHGHASIVTIEFSISDANARPRMLVIDNGKGIDEDRPLKKTGVGLRIMQQRCESIGLNLTLARGPEGGTIVRVD